MRGMAEAKETRGWFKDGEQMSKIGKLEHHRTNQPVDDHLLEFRVATDVMLATFANSSNLAPTSYTL